RAVIAEGIASCECVPGRFDQVVSDHTADFRVIVDYAHTDDALRKVLHTAREVAGESGRVIAVFGCGGDRDRTKRPLMGEAAATLADVAIATSDNPRTEDPDSILDEVEPGLRKSGRSYIRITDRKQAIFHAVGEARSGDVILIAGKGHETYQIIGTTRNHFDDREVARQALAERGRTAEASKAR
ncbi:MAG TPA: cyanophycin synthetase, partial [Blastocatellia bacterium]